MNAGSGSTENSEDIDGFGSSRFDEIPDPDEGFITGVDIWRF